MGEPARVLVVEDEAKLALVLRQYLEAAGYATDWLETGDAVVPWMREHGADLVALDLTLPGRDGLEVCRELRTFTQVPIIMLTARVEEIDRLLGLELGADDYVCKPYSPREVVARVRTVLRRTGAEPAGNTAGGETRGGTLQPDRGTLQLDRGALRARAGAEETTLTAVEFALLATLHAAPGRIFSRDQLMDRIYDDRRVVSDRTIDSHVKKLRRKLAELVPDRELVHSVYGVGYRYEDADG